MYDPIFFNYGLYGDTGSYIDTEWYQEALRSGAAQPTPYKAVRSASQGRYLAYPSYDEAFYDHGYEEYVPGYGPGEDFMQGYGFEYGDPYYYDYYEHPPPVPRGRGRAPPGGRAYHSRGFSRGFRARGNFGARGVKRDRGSLVKPEAMDCTESGADTAGQSTH